MIYIEHFRETIGFQTVAIGNESTLEITHPALATPHTSVECIYRFGSEPVYSAGNIATCIRLVKKAGDIHLPVGIHIQWLFIVYKIGHSHHTVGLTALQ